MASIPIQFISNDISVDENVSVKILFPFGNVVDRVSISEDIGMWTDILYINVSEEVSISEQIYHLYNLGPLTAPNPDLDTEFDCSGNDSAGNPDVGVIDISVGLSGTSLNTTFLSSPISISFTLQGTGVDGAVIDGGSIDITFGVYYKKVYISVGEQNFIQWGKVGTLDFTIDNSNIAGKRPMSWSGMIHRIIKTPTGAIVYGANGITVITPASNERSRYDSEIPEAHTYAPQTIYETGIKGKNGVVETLSGHYCVDVNGKLCKINSDGIQIIDFSEYFSSLSSNIVMSFDKVNDLIYICDGTLGFIYNIKDNSLGSGPATITGFGYKDGTSYIMSSVAITTPALNVTTDIFDFGTTRTKTIHSVEIGTDVSNILSIALDYRKSKAESFSTTPWALVNPKGQAYLPCYGKEFRLKIKINTYESFDIDWIKVHGDINDN